MICSCRKFNKHRKCMVNRICSKKISKDFTSTTITGKNGYPQYRKRCPLSGGFKSENKL